MAAKTLPSAIFWLPQRCSCSKIEARAAGLWQPKCCWQQHFSCHNPAVSSIMAEYLAIILLPAGLWRSNIKALHRYCITQSNSSCVSDRFDVVCVFFEALITSIRRVGVVSTSCRRRRAASDPARHCGPAVGRSVSGGGGRARRDLDVAVAASFAAAVDVRATLDAAPCRARCCCRCASE